jgi:UDP-N-acetylmuramate dehydrogenase
MTISSNVSLKHYHTFSIDCIANQLVQFEHIDELKDFLLQKQISDQKFLILGGGSNLLFTETFYGIVLKPDFKGIIKTDETENDVFIRVNAGENWDKFTEYCAQNNYYGVENLAYIPGNVGASPVQNIGAYGVEVKDAIFEVQTLEIETGNEKVFSNAECRFGYRDSIFKNKLKNKYIVTSVIFKLSKKERYNLDYGQLKHRLETVKNYGIKDVRQAVIEIRNSKLPNPDMLPNAGSFFKNPVISLSQFYVLKKNYPELVNYPVGDSQIKLAAGQLIELAGLKGCRAGNVGVHEQQALVIVNYGVSSGKEIYEFSKFVQKTVFEKFGVELEAEVNII